MVEAGQSDDPCSGTPHVPLSTARRAPAPDPGCGAPPGGERSGDPWDLVTVPTRQGLEAVDILRRGASEAVGPVLHDGSRDTLGFLVPPGTADAWDVPGSTCTQTDGHGRRLVTEGLDDSGPPAGGSGWLVPPDESDPATDPAVLRAALDEAARLIEAADNCR